MCNRVNDSHNVEQKQPDTVEYLLYDSISIW